MNYAKDSIETYSYEVTKRIGNIEIRTYEEANFLSYTMDNQTYSETSSAGFRVLAGYIFGDNAENKKIAMTAPVSMEMNDSVTMRFMVPSKFELSDLPDPNNPNIKFETLPGQTMAAIRFGGWANDTKIEVYKKQLKESLDAADITYDEPFVYFGYDAPYTVVNRRNEVLVKVLLD